MMRKGTPQLCISKFGEVDEGFVQWVRDTLSECYEKVNVETLELVDVYLFEKEEYAKASMREDKMRLGIDTTLDEAFITTHDAWTGIPRIFICVETLNRIPYEVRRGALHHEATHSILHGSLEFYMISIPRDLQDLVEKLHPPSALIQGIIYLASVAVKDYEVTKLLYERGFIDDQVAFAAYFLQPSDEEMTAWVMASASSTTIILFLVSLMKSIACALPLADDGKWGGQISMAIKSYINYLPEEQKRTLLDIMKIFKNFTGQFHEDLRAILREITKTFSQPS